MDALAIEYCKGNILNRGYWEKFLMKLDIHREISNLLINQPFLSRFLSQAFSCAKSTGFIRLQSNRVKMRKPATQNLKPAPTQKNCSYTTDVVKNSTIITKF